MEMADSSGDCFYDLFVVIIVLVIIGLLIIFLVIIVLVIIIVLVKKKNFEFLKKDINNQHNNATKNSANCLAEQYLQSSSSYHTEKRSNMIY